MRGLATLVAALLLLLSPLGAAQGDGGPPSDPPRQGPPGQARGDGNVTQAEECPPQGNATGNSTGQDCPRAEPEDDPADGPREWRRWCRAEARSDVQRERCREALSEYEEGAGRESRWVSFRVDAANVTLLDYRVGGLLVADSIRLDTGSDNLTVQSSGAVLRLADRDTELALHDNPTGLVRFKGEDGNVTIVLPSDARVDHTADGSAARIAYPGGRIAHLRSDNATFLDDHTVRASGFLALLVSAPRSESQAPQPDAGAEERQEREDREQRVQSAIDQRKVGAEITLRSPAQAAQSQRLDGVEVLAYDDVRVQVRLPSAAVATPEAPIRVEVSAELAEGRTIVLNLDRAMLASDDPRGLVLRYFDLDEHPDGSIVETEVAFRQASSLQDVLDATDDGGEPEYWIVEDANGLQVLASVPHWSTHAITVGSLAQFAAPSVVAGIALGIAGSLAAAAVLVWPRRPEDD